MKKPTAKKFESSKKDKEADRKHGKPEGSKEDMEQDRKDGKPGRSGMKKKAPMKKKAKK